LQIYFWKVWEPQNMNKYCDCCANCSVANTRNYQTVLNMFVIARLF